jgi:hypothetical protein
MLTEFGTSSKRETARSQVPAFTWDELLDQQYDPAMPPTEDDVEVRLATVERQVAELRKQLALASSDAAAARTLAAGADHDVSEVRAELRAHTQALNALREIQLELRETQFEQSREMREGFATLATGMAKITELLTNRDSEGLE